MKKKYQILKRINHGIGMVLSTKSLLRAFDITREKGPKKIGPTSVPPKVMCSTNSATLSTYFKIKGVNYSISSMFYKCPLHWKCL